MYFQLAGSIFIIACLVVIDRLIKGKTFEKAVFIAITALYSAGLVYLTMFRGERVGISGVSIRFPLPILDAVMNCHYGLMANRSVLNILLFVPFGYLLPKLFSLFHYAKPIHWWVITLGGLLLSLLIESLQLLFHCGVFELDDLVKNTMGTAIGYAIFRALNRGDYSYADK